MDTLRWRRKKRTPNKAHASFPVLLPVHLYSTLRRLCCAMFQDLSKIVPAAFRDVSGPFQNSPRSFLRRFRTLPTSLPLCFATFQGPQHSTAPHSTAQHRTAPHSTSHITHHPSHITHHTAQRRTAQHITSPSTAQCNAAHHTSEKNRTQQHRA